MKLYIDPGTGSMMFAILIGLVGVLNWMLKGWIVKLRFLFSAGKTRAEASKKIPFVIFSDDKRYWSVFKPVCEELSNREFDVVYMTASPDDPALKVEMPHFKPEFIGEGNKAFAKLNLLSATIVMATTPGLEVYQWKRSRGVDYYIHMLHAANDIIYRMFGLDYYDSVMISGDYMESDIRELERRRNLPAKETVMIGIPYMDKMVERLRANPPEPNKIRTVLLAPSWGQSAIFSRFGGRIIDVLKETGYHIIIRPHPQSFKSETAIIEKLMEAYPESEQLEWNRDADNFECLKKADILISDFSGVVFDFSLVYDKPVIYTDTDYSNGPYDSAWLDEPMWTFRAMPLLGEKLTIDNLDSIKELIDKCLTEQRYIEGRKQARAETWCYPGEGTKRAADYIIEKYKALTAEDNTQKEQTA